MLSQSIITTNFPQLFNNKDCEILGIVNVTSAFPELALFHLTVANNNTWNYAVAGK